MGKEEGEKEKGEAYPYQHFLKFGSTLPCQFYWGVMVDDVWDNKQLAELSTLLMNLATYLKIKFWPLENKNQAGTEYSVFSIFSLLEAQLTVLG